MRMKKRILFQEAKTLKNGRKRTKNGYRVNSPLGRILSFLTLDNVLR